MTIQFPNSPDAERGVLASLLLEPAMVRAICAAEGMTAQWLYLPAHRLIWEAATGLVDTGRKVDMLTLGQRLKDTGNLDDAGGAPYLMELWGYLPSAANVRDYLDVVREKHIRRAIIAASILAVTAAQQDGDNAVEIAGELHKSAGELLQTRQTRPNHREVLQSIIDEVREGRDDANLIHIPIPAVHGRLRVYRGDLLMITAPTSCGKTALATQMALAVAGARLRVAIYPLEMAQAETMKRAIAQTGGHNPDFVRKLVKDNAGKEPTKFVREAVEDFMKAARELADLDIHLRDDLSRWDQIRADIRMEHGRRPFAFVLVDYLQLIQSSGRHERRQLAIAEITQGAKLLAGELSCVICMPSQVNKEGGTREAQDAENDASSLIKIHPLEGAAEPEPGRVTVWKQRNGKRHIDLPLKFNPTLTRFEYQEVTRRKGEGKE